METVTCLASYTAWETQSEALFENLQTTGHLNKHLSIHLKLKFLWALCNTLINDSLDTYGASFMLKTYELEETSV